MRDLLCHLIDGVLRGWRLSLAGCASHVRQADMIPDLHVTLHMLCLHKAAVVVQWPFCMLQHPCAGCNASAQRYGYHAIESLHTACEHCFASINVQAYVSRARAESFSLTADMTYVSQNAPRICRALFEICLRRSWSTAAEMALTMCKVGALHPLTIPGPTPVMEAGMVC